MYAINSKMTRIEQLERAVDVLDITEDANLQVRAGAVLQANGAVETLVLVRVVVLQTHLELDRFLELALDTWRAVQQ